MIEWLNEWRVLLSAQNMTKETGSGEFHIFIFIFI